MYHLIILRRKIYYQLDKNLNIQIVSGVVRDCFLPSSIVLGTPQNPLRPELNCTIRNIPVGIDDVQTCLCTLPFCNDLPLESDWATNLETKSLIASEDKSYLLENNPAVRTNSPAVSNSGKNYLLCSDGN